MFLKWLTIIVFSISLCKYKAEKISSFDNQYDPHMLTKPLTNYRFSKLTFPKISFTDTEM